MMWTLIVMTIPWDFIWSMNTSDRGDFDEIYNLQVLENCRPSDLEKKEHLFIHKFGTLYPLGLNKINPFGLPILSA